MLSTDRGENGRSGCFSARKQPISAVFMSHQNIRGTILLMVIGDDDTRAYRRCLPHLEREGKTYFSTFTALNREVLPPDARDIALACCVAANDRDYLLHCAMVMPDHVHLILTPHRGVRLYRIMQRIKSRSVHGINRLMQRKGTLWSEESFDHILRAGEKREEKMAYVLNNPVRAGLVLRPEDWPWRFPR